MSDYFEKEKLVLSKIMFDNEFIQPLLQYENFFTSQKARDIYDIFIKLNEKKIPINYITIHDYVRENKLNIPIEDYTNISDSVDVIKWDHSYNEVIKELINQRMKNRIKFMAAQLDKYNPIEVIAFIQNEINEISKSTASQTKNIQQICYDYINKPPNENGVYLGYDWFDNRNNGAQNSELIIIAARPGDGKTTYIINPIRKQLLTNIKVGMFSTEMEAIILLRKIVSAYTAIPDLMLKNDTLTNVQKHEMCQALELFHAKNFYVNDVFAIDIDLLCVEAKKMRENHGIQILYVDYLQLLSCSLKTDIRAEKIKYITEKLKGLAKDLKIPIISLAQMNREIDGRDQEEYNPQFRDLADGSAIEKTADLICFMRQNPNQINGKFINDFVIKKNRNGETGRFQLEFVKPICKFMDYNKT